MKFINKLFPKRLRNNIGAVSFDGIDDKLQRTSSVISGTVYTTYCRFKLNLLSSTESIFSITNIGSSSNYLVFSSRSGNDYVISLRGGGGTPNSNGWAQLTWGVVDTNWHTMVFIAIANDDFEDYFEGDLVKSNM